MLLQFSVLSFDELRTMSDPELKNCLRVSIQISTEWGMEVVSFNCVVYLSHIEVILPPAHYQTKIFRAMCPVIVQIENSVVKIKFSEYIQCKQGSLAFMASGTICFRCNTHV